MTSTTDAAGSDLAARVQRMDRRALLRELTHFDPGFKLDFTEAFLASRSNEQLRHILLAAYLQARNRARSAARPAGR